MDDREAAEATVTIDGRSLLLTSLDKVMYPETGFTKRDVIDYYRKLATPCGWGSIR